MMMKKNSTKPVTENVNNSKLIPLEKLLHKTVTGIAGLNEITQGSLPEGLPTLVCGNEACGKTISGLEFLVRDANKELAFQNEEKHKRAEELLIANKELAFQNEEKHKRAEELLIANKELAFQNAEKEKRAAAFHIANNELLYQTDQKAKRADELSIANKELAFQNEEKEKRAAELIIANKELAFQNAEKEKRANELLLANEELAFQNEEKHKRAEELLIANDELAFQNAEKEKRANELMIANEELVYQNEEKQKRAEELSIANEELVFLNRQQQALFAAIVNSSDDAMLSKTLDGVITSWNHGAEKIFGYSADEIIGKNVLTLMPAELQQEEAEITKRIQHGETLDHYETKRLRKNGDVFYASLSISPIRNFEGNIIGASKVLCDITEQKKGDEERKGLAERLQLATKSAGMGIWEWDIETNTLEADEGMYKLYGITTADFNSVYDGWMSRIHNEDSQNVANELQLAITNKKDYDTEFRVVWSDSSIHYLRASGIVERDNNGKAQRIIGINWDITQSKKAEAEIKSFNESLESKIIERTQQLEAVNKELESFSYSVSHDLRAPLRAVNSYAQIMIEEYGKNLDEDGLKILESIRYNGEKMGRLIDELLAFSKMGRKKPQLETVNLDELIKRVMTDIGEHYPIHAVIKISPLPVVQADNTMLYLVLYNLLSNAVKYSSKKEHPVIEVFTQKKTTKRYLW